MTESKIVEGVGISVQTSMTGSPALGKLIEAAMAQAVKDTQTDSEAIAAGPGTDEEKAALITTLNDPAVVQNRMLVYRDAVKAKARGE